MPLFSEPARDLSRVISSVLKEANSRSVFAGLKKGGK
jgi:hypothetical protein